MRSEQVLNLPKAVSSDNDLIFFPQEKLNEGKADLRKHHQNEYISSFSMWGTGDEGEIWILGKLWLLQVLWESQVPLILFFFYNEIKGLITFHWFGIKGLQILGF